MAIGQGRDSTTADLIAAIAGRVPSRNLHSRVLWQLGTAIVRGDYPEGSILPSDTELLARFAVSRTVLREALKTLAAKGMIEARARIGTRVLPRQRWNLFDADVLAWHFEIGPDVALLRSLSEIRIGVEVESAALAAVRRSEEQAAALEACAIRMGEATTPQQFARTDLEFHRTVAEASGNPFMASISALVELALTAAFTISSPVEDDTAMVATVKAHGRIAEAIRAGDAEEARAAMKAVISEGFARAEGRLEPGKA
ncbi:MAG: FadR family transcriptional regulator [Alphaproteobacteria bacterium]|nr:FadR family transcriptional regulator [Alphaproteobacteria bacterium]MBU1561261.1 FadR family transcriptional regulator [Alphaproteobacteria bacterium]MBU2301217.1 FadR family transcriptional regulator [Alphaproteobacteria bacterium]MBU2367752.1 FadR family transcriptional regulator [Alphaproteobacteria bacterium]